MRTEKALLFATSALCLVARVGWADDVGKVFVLGEVTTTAPASEASTASDTGGTVITQQDIRDNNRESVDQAVQLAPGTGLSFLGARNETNIFIRGFDRWRVPVYYDGILVNLPYDGRVDFSQFGTSALSEIQVSKSYSSVIDGPGAIGGSINMVSRQVTKPFEGDGRIGTSFNRDGSYNGVTADTFVGGKIGDFYLQGAASETRKNNFELSDDYTGGTLQSTGLRRNSAREDYTFNVKAGYTPNATDEYSINVVTLNGMKQDPPPDLAGIKNSLTSSSSTKYWDWPSWDKQSVYWLSNTALDDQGSYIKTKAYYDRYFNNLMIYDNLSYSTQDTSSGQNSKYLDVTSGGSIEIAKSLFGGRDVIRASTIYRYDQHNEWAQQWNSNGKVKYTTPWETAEENTYSQAIENTFHPTKDWDLKAGISYDYRQMIGDTEWINATSAPYGYNFQFPVANKEAFNYQAASIYHYSDTGSAHLTFSDRSRFPTLFEMYSTRFNRALQNPYLRPEEAFTFEAGVSDTIGDTHFGVNAYHARMINAIENVAVSSTLSQEQNAGVEIHEGFEIDILQHVMKDLDIGGYYAYLMRAMVEKNLAVPTDSPRHKAFIHADWQAMEGLKIISTAEITGKRWLQDAYTNTLYHYAGDAVVLSIKAQYAINKTFDVEGGIKNLADQNYEMADGFHAEGRNFFTNVRMKF